MFSIPIYTLLVIIFFLPVIWLILSKNKKLDKKKMIAILALCVIATIIWDTAAIKLDLWSFTKTNVSLWILGIPLEEYIFGLWLPITVLGIYTSLPKFRVSSLPEPHIREVPLISFVFLLQFITMLFMISNPVSYFKWTLFLAIIPSIFYLWRKGEKIDEIRLIITCALMVIIFVLVDLTFVPLGAWFYNDFATLGHYGYIYYDDFIFGVSNSILLVGLYTSLPSKNILKGKW